MPARVAYMLAKAEPSSHYRTVQLYFLRSSNGIPTVSQRYTKRYPNGIWTGYKRDLNGISTVSQIPNSIPRGSQRDLNGKLCYFGATQDALHFPHRLVIEGGVMHPIHIHFE